MVDRVCDGAKVRPIQSVFDVDQRVGEVALVYKDRLPGIVALAGRIGGHVDLLGRRGGACKVHHAADAGGGCGIDGRQRGLGLGSSVGR